MRKISRFMNQHMKENEMKIGIMIGGFLASTAVASASLGGFYAGIGGGYNGVRIKEYSISNNSGQYLFDQKRFKGSSLWGGMIGWGLQSNCLYAGIEFETFYNNVERQLYRDISAGINTVEKFHLHHKFQYGAGLRFGFTHTFCNSVKALFFARMGAQIGKWSFKYTVTDPDLPKGKYGRASHINRLSYIPGLGIEVMMGEKFSVRGEVRYVPLFVKRLIIPNVFHGTINANFEDSTNSFRVTQNSAIMTFVYHI